MVSALMEFIVFQMEQDEKTNSHPTRQPPCLRALLIVGALQDEWKEGEPLEAGGGGCSKKVLFIAT